jgi:hypothetical protein
MLWVIVLLIEAISFLAANPALSQSLDGAKTRLTAAENVGAPYNERLANSLAAAEMALGFATRGTEQATRGQARQIYNAATLQAILLLRIGNHTTNPEQINGAGGSYIIRFQPAGPGRWAPDYFDELRPVAESDDKAAGTWVVGSGFGAVLLGIHNPRSDELLAPRIGFACSVTAILDFAVQKNGPNEKTVSITFYNPNIESTVRLGDTVQPLAYDLSAVWGHYARSYGYIPAVIRRPDILHDGCGLYMTEPYDPNRIPVVLVHGYLSWPQMYFNLAATIKQDPELRPRYQIWMFYYLSSNPIVLSALTLRTDLEAANQFYHPKHGFVLIGHSMGGLISQLQSVDSGRVLWNQVFGNRADQLYQSVPANALIKQSLVFGHLPEVRRIIFICVPHHGSQLASNPLSSLTDGILLAPGVLSKTLRGKTNTAFLSAGGITLPTGYAGLSPHSPILIGLGQLPIQTRYNSIIGKVGGGDLAHSSDGLVPYWSSHIDYADSEKIIPRGHLGYQSPEAVTEVRRILRQHWRSEGVFGAGQ